MKLHFSSRVWTFCKFVLRTTRVCWKRIPRNILILYAVTFLILIPHLCFRLRFSLVNLRKQDKDSERENLWSENRQRLVTSQRIIDNFRKKADKPNQSRRFLHTENVDVAIVAVTVNRDTIAETNPHYLTQSVGRLIYLIENRQEQIKRKYGIFLCNVDTANYDDVEHLKDLLPVFNRFANEQEATKDVFKKEQEDYIFCLEETLKRNAPYMLLLEDDAFAHDDLVPVVEMNLDNIEKKPPTAKKTAFIKLYHPERLLGYINLEWERIPELIAVSLAFGTILWTIFTRCSHNRHRTVIWCACVVYCCAVALVVGRVNLLELRRAAVQTYQLTPAAPDSMVALLYTKYGAELIATNLKNVTCKHGYAKDTALNDIRRNNSLRVLQVQPNVFKHIGLVSSLRRAMIDPFIV